MIKKTGCYITWAGVAALLLILTNISCNFRNPADNFTVRVEFNPVSTVIGGQIVNSSNGLPIEGQTVDVVITGDGKNLVVDLTGKDTTNFLINNGFVSFGLKSGTQPSPASPIKITVVTHANGFLSNSKPLVIDDTTSFQFKVSMVSVTDTTKGVKVVESKEAETDGNGIVKNNVQIKTEPDPLTKALAEIFIPKDTRITDKNGNPLTGKLTTTVAYHNNQSSESLASFPGGFSVTLSENENGMQQDAVFISGGFASIEIKDPSGKTATGLIPSIQISIQIPGGTINPETGVAIANGNTISIWSYDPDTGKWKFESKGTVTGPNADGNFTVNFQTKHLSYYNLDWSFSFPNDACRESRKIILNGYDGRPGVSIKIKAVGGGFEKTLILYELDNCIFFNNVPANVPAKLEVFYEGRVIASSVIANLCGDGDISINIDLPSNSIDVSVSVKAFCRNRSDVEIRPSMPIYYKKVNATQWIYAGTMLNGKITIRGLQPSQEYNFRATYEGVTETIKYFIEPDKTTINFDVEIPADLCE